MLLLELVRDFDIIVSNQKWTRLRRLALESANVRSKDFFSNYNVGDRYRVVFDQVLSNDRLEIVHRWATHDCGTGIEPVLLG